MSKVIRGRRCMRLRKGRCTMAFAEHIGRRPQTVMDWNADDFTPEAMAEEIYEGLPLDRARRIIEFVQQDIPHRA